MSLIQIPAPSNILGDEFTILASTIGEHFAISPNIEIDGNDEIHFDTAAWTLHHLPSGKIAAQLFQADPHEWPGEPRALDPRSIRRFVAWLESRIDCSNPDVDFGQLSDEDRKKVSLFRHEPNYFDPNTTEE